MYQTPVAIAAKVKIRNKIFVIYRILLIRVLLNPAFNSDRKEILAMPFSKRFVNWFGKERAALN
jgi:hypothetical protein